MKNPPRPWLWMAQLMALWAFLVMAPTLDLIRGNGEFFIEYQVGPLDLAVILLVLAVGVPAAVVLPLAAVRRGWPRIGTWLTAGLAVPMLGTLFLAEAGLWIGARSPALAYAVSLSLGAAVWLAVLRWNWAAQYCALLCLGYPVFLGLFLWSPEVREAEHRAAKVEKLRIGRPTPVVLLVLDELPLASLLDDQGHLDAARYPNFAALASDSDWFYRATTVATMTTDAVPAMLSSRLPIPNGRPSVAQYPDNLFTALSGTLRIQATESHTDLAPRSVRSGRSEGSLELAWLVLRLTVRRFVINTTTEVVAQGFRDILDREVGSRFRGASRKISEYTPETDLFYWHLALPHLPWEFLPDGTCYLKGELKEKPLPGMVKLAWTDNDFLRAQAYQRHLLQVEAVDRLLGQLLRRLKETQVYDRCLLIVLSDHGCGFSPGQHWRYGGLRSDLLAVPLFVKWPGQHAGRRRPDPATLLDILPTILNQLQVSWPWKLEGQDLRQPVQREKLVLLDSRDQQYYTLSPDRIEVEESLRHRRGLVDVDDLYRLKGAPSLPARPGAPLPVRVEIANLSDYANVAPETGFLPCFIWGTLSGPGAHKLGVAVLVNDRPVATGLAYSRPDGKAGFSVLFPPEALKPGANQVEIRAIHQGRLCPLQ